MKPTALHSVRPGLDWFSIFGRCKYEQPRSRVLYLSWIAEKSMYWCYRKNEIDILCEAENYIHWEMWKVEKKHTMEL